MAEQTHRLSVSSSAFADTIKRHKAFWKRSEDDSFLRSTGVFAPSTPLGLPQRDGSHITHAETVTPDMIDVSAMIDEFEALDATALDSTLAVKGQYLIGTGLGDQMPISRPIPKIPWIEAMLGCPITMTEGHIWNEH
jgi:hypothetical protein